MTNQKVYAFAKVGDEEFSRLIYNEIKSGKSRFGMWGQTKSLKEEYYGRNRLLLEIEKDDWIVYVNMPTYGRCVAVKAVDGYEFDEGILIKEWGTHDFNNYIPVDPLSIVEFSRNDMNVLPSVNLAPRRRIQRVSEVSDFLQSLENIENQTYSGSKSERSVLHLREKVEQLLPTITAEIQRMNRSKEFEKFLKKVFDNMPNTSVVTQNGFGWKSDNGADLIVEFDRPVIGVSVSTKLIVQAKSYEGDHYDKHAIDQIAEGMKAYNADAGLLITTANETEELEEYVREKSDSLDKTIDVIAGDDVAKFVLRYAPELLIGE